MATSRADDWRGRGAYFSWSPVEGGAPSVDIFHVEMGDPKDPVLLLVHGWPTSSIDWYGVAPLLSTRFRVCALDFPGYGFSDKPEGWGYTLRRDEELLEYYLSEVIGAKAVIVVAHDRGDSVALLHAVRCSEGRSAGRLEHLVVSNGNIFLPMSQLTGVQRNILDKEIGPQMLRLAESRPNGRGDGFEYVYSSSRAWGPRGRSSNGDIRPPGRRQGTPRDNPILGGALR